MTRTVYPPLRDELARALTKHRGGKNAGQIADEILQRDGSNYTIVGLDADAEQVFTYEVVSYSLFGISIEEDGLGSRMGSYVRKIAGWGGFQEWLAEQDPDEFAWLHPRHRWVFDY